MSQFKHKALKTIALCALLGPIMAPVTANAAMTSSQGRHVIYKTTFNEVDGVESAILNWKNQSAEFTFDMADSDWTDGLELLLSADPLGKVSSRTPVMVQFNNGKPIPIVTRGQGFDTRIKLDKAKIRPRRNKIRFTYKTPSGAECLLPQHGGWRLNFNDSFVVVKARAKSRNFYLNEIEARLGNATTAPKTVSILARGQSTAKLQALAAQGVGMRVKTLPDFKTTKSNSEFEIILGRRDELYGWVTDKNILNGSGPTIGVHKGRPMRLVITGDTDAEVMSTASAFASRSLPTTRRTKTSLGEINYQSPFQANHSLIQGTAKVSELGGTYFEGGWGPSAKRLTFNVADPVASHGEVLLRLASNKNVNKDSRVSVELNGKSLGFTKLDKTRKSVAFDIPEGSLQGTNNVLTITPELALAKNNGCNFAQNLPGFSIGNSSRIKIETPKDSPIAELSKMTATGAPFSLDQGKETLIVLPAGSSRDYGASLKILAKLAKSSGGGWTDANYMRSTNYAALSPEKNILFIGPSRSFNGPLRNSAPKGLTSALKGKTLTGTGRFIAEAERFAANDEDLTLRLYAARKAKTGRIGQGGVAAIYPSPLASGKVLGVITNVPGRGFSQVANQLVKPNHWNNLEGSVARWNKSHVLMAQTAMSVPGFVGPKPKHTVIDKLAADLSLPTFDMPSLDWSSLRLDDFDMDLAKTKLRNFKARVLELVDGSEITEGSSTIQKTATVHVSKASIPSFVAPQKSTFKISVPNLRQTDISADPTVTLELRGLSQIRSKSEGSFPMVNTAKTKVRTWWQNQGIKDKVNALKAKTAQVIPSSTSAKDISAGKTVKWKDYDMSMSMLLLILIVGGIFALMGLATPQTQTKPRY